MKKRILIPTKKLLGIYIFIIGLSILIKILFPDLEGIYFILSFIIIVSINFIIKSVRLQKSKRFIIPGITLLLSSVFFLFYLLFFKNIYRFDKIWPILGLFPSISLIFYYIISTRKSPATIIPGLFIGLMSFVLLLITTGIFKIKFTDFLIMLLAGMIIVIGLYLMFDKQITNIKKHIKDKVNSTENTKNQKSDD
ncbi:MAG: hypothetical protein KAT05_13930 [Spirochaetes bacterium]|nr:hypothetical protein [Spirochaetota bacterium]